MENTSINCRSRLRTWRERRGLTQAELARRIGVHFTTISQLENGRMKPSVELLAAWARELRRPVGNVLSAVLSRVDGGSEALRKFRIEVHPRHAQSNIICFEAERTKRRGTEDRPHSCI